MAKTLHRSEMTASADSFSTNQTFFQFNWPKGITGLERIALTAKGDLQRTLSAYFSRPIQVERIWEKEAVALQPEENYTPSAANPTTQTRRVHLRCSGKIVCICTSTIIMSTKQTADLFLIDKFAIGQMFRKLDQAPEFILHEVGVEPGEDGKETLWRRYSLKTDGFECSILEVFPDRAMFTKARWIAMVSPEMAAAQVANSPPRLALSA